MKKVIGILISVCLILSAVPCVFADDAESADTEAVLTLIKPRIPDTSCYPNFNSDISRTENNTRYFFNWNSDDGAMRLIVNSNGIIMSYDELNSNDEKVSISKRSSYEDAEKKAAEFFAYLNPMLAEKYRVEKINQQNIYGNCFYFKLQRYENGIPVKNEIGNISVLADCSRVMSMNLIYTEDCVFESNKNIISADEAKKALTEKVGIKPQYDITYNYDESSVTTDISYRNTLFSGKYISAVSGDVLRIDNDFTILYNDDIASIGFAGEASKERGLSPAELENIDKVKELQSTSDIEKKLKSNKYLNIPNNAEISSDSLYYDRYLDRYIKTLYYNTDNIYINVKVDAKTGDVLHFSRNSENEAKHNSEYAENAIKSLAGNKLKEYKKAEDNHEYTEYIRYVNGIVCPEQTISANTNGNNLLNYSMNHLDIAFKSTKGMLTEHDAAEKMFEASEYKPFYVLNNEKSYLLVYDFSDNEVFIDAFTGESIGNTQSGFNYNDISGHWAEEKIKTLAMYGIGFEGNEFKPDENITEKEFTKLLNCVFYRTMNDEFTDAPLTRLAAVNILIKALNLENIAALDIYRISFPDVTESTGAVAILYGLKVISGNPDGTFCPDNILTRAEAACMLYNCLNADINL